MRILFICEQCNPDQPSVPLLGYEFYKAIRDKADVQLVTHGRNEESLKKHFPEDSIDFIHESYFSGIWGNWMVSSKWSLQHILFYPLWLEFNHKVFEKYKSELQNYDLIHAFTPIIPRYPYKIAKLAPLPFLLGPVNGGLPFPPGYEEVAYQEGSRFNVFKKWVKNLPGYTDTYQNAKLILSGSKHTEKEIHELFPNTPIELFSENGVDLSFYNPHVNESKQIKVLFVGRLTPYKGADILIEAIKQCPEVHLNIAGSGPEKENLERLIDRYNLSERVRLLGFIPHKDLPKLYHESHLFAFPSIREFGGAVVMEAMAASLPCIIPDYGGIAEYLPISAGFKVPLKTREELIDSFADKINLLANDLSLRKKMGEAGFREAQKFKWKEKGEALIRLYQKLI